MADGLCQVRDNRHLQWSLVRAGLSVRRSLAGDTLRAYADKIGISAATLLRAERGSPIAISSLLKICAFLKLHPFGWCLCVSVGVPRETGLAA